LLLPEKSFICETSIFHGHVQKASKSVCTSTVLVFLDPLSPVAAVKSPENTEKRSLMILNQQLKEMSKMEYFCY
jgi:hypothetical protein